MQTEKGDVAREMKVLKTNDSAIMEWVMSHGGRMLSHCVETSGKDVYSLDISQVDINEMNANEQFGVYQYTVFSVEHPTLMF